MTAIARAVHELLDHFRSHKVCYRRTGEVVENTTNGTMGVVRCIYRNQDRLIEWMAIKIVSGVSFLNHHSWSFVNTDGGQGKVRAFNFNSLVHGWQAQKDRWQDQAQAAEDAAQDRMMS